MIRDQEILNQLLDTVSRYVRERLVPIEAQVAEENAIPEDVIRSEEHTSELQSLTKLVCRLLLEKKKEQTT